jgi:hypothetical protein
MRFVLDLNMSRDEKLIDILKDGHNIILIDDFFVELFKSNDPVKTFELNTKILQKYSSQIYYCHDIGILFRLEKIGRPLKKHQLIDMKTTSIIRKLILMPDIFQSQIEKFKIEASKRISEQENFIQEYLRKTTQQLSALLKSTASRNAYIVDKEKRLCDIMGTTFLVMERYLIDNKNKKLFWEKPSVIFNYTYILLWRIVDWALKNGITDKPINKLTNDGFDLRYIMYSSYFDDVLTKESWLSECRSDCMLSFKCK